MAYRAAAPTALAAACLASFMMLSNATLTPIMTSGTPLPGLVDAPTKWRPWWGYMGVRGGAWARVAETPLFPCFFQPNVESPNREKTQPARGAAPTEAAAGRLLRQDLCQDLAWILGESRQPGMPVCVGGRKHASCSRPCERPNTAPCLML